MSPRFGDRGANGGREARSAEAREHDRVERERRRAAREGHGAGVPPPSGPPAREPEPEPAREGDPVREPGPAVPERPALRWDAATDEPAVSPRRRQATPDPAARITPRPVRERPQVDLPGAGDEPAVRVLGGDLDDDRPLGTRRVAATALATAAGAPGPPRFGAPPRGVPRTRRGMRRVVPAVLILLLLVAAYGVNKVVQPFHGDGTGSVRIVIPPGSGAQQIGDALVRAGVVDSGTIFSLRARLSGDRDKLRSGVHVLRRNMSYSAALAALTTAPASAPTVSVAIPEGLTIRQMASLAHRAALRGSYTKATQDARTLRAARAMGLPARTQTVEGYLFPATYQLRTGASAATLVAQQLRSFRRATAGLQYTYATSRGLTRYDVLIIASLIENEAQTAKDRPLIAAVIYNRLKQGIPLGIDATTRYETGNYGVNGRPIRQSELNADTPYNTRRRRGLPPTPISSPGAASLRAAARPANVPYVYYVVRPCGRGAHSFSTTNAAFQADLAAYNRKRAQLGGRDPSIC